MKRAAIRAALVALSACASATVIAQDEAGPPALDLSVPAERIQFASTGADADSTSPPPGAWRPITLAEAEAKANGDWQVHGAVEAGVGWSKQTGNSNWQALNLNLDKTTTTDDGDTRHFNIDINVGQGEGALFGPGYPGYFNGPGYYGPPMRGRGGFIR